MKRLSRGMVIFLAVLFSACDESDVQPRPTNPSNQPTSTLYLPSPFGGWLQEILLSASNDIYTFRNANFRQNLRVFGSRWEQFDWQSGLQAETVTLSYDAGMNRTLSMRLAPTNRGTVLNTTYRDFDIFTEANYNLDGNFDEDGNGREDPNHTLSTTTLLRDSVINGKVYDSIYRISLNQVIRDRSLTGSFARLYFDTQMGLVRYTQADGSNWNIDK